MEIEEAKRRAKGAPLILMMKRLILLSVTFISTVTVARLISPREYGLANMSFVLLGFVQIFRDFGMTNAILRKGLVTEAELNFLFWCNTGATSVLFTLIVVLSPAASLFYHEPVVKWVMMVSAIAFLTEGITLQHRIILSRDLRFGTLTRIDITGTLVGFFVTLGLAYIRHDVWAIIFGYLASSLTTSAQCVIASGWRASRPRYYEDWRSVLTFAANSSVYTLSVFLSENMLPVLIGRSLGSASLGQFNRAYTLYQLPKVNLVNPIVQALMPLLLRLRSNNEEYKVAYLGLLRRLAIAIIPIAVTLMFAGEPLVETLLGDRWKLAGKVLEALAPGLVAIAIASETSDLFITQDRSAALRKLGLLEVVCRIGAVIVSVPFGVVVAAIGFSLSSLILAAVRIIVAGRQGPVTAMGQFGAIAPSLLPALAAGLASALARALPPHHPIVSTLLIGGAGGMAALITSIVFPASRAALVELADTFGLSRLAGRVKRLHAKTVHSFRAG